MKKRNLLLTLACSTLLLTSCDKIVATLPNETGDQALTDAKIELDHNTLETIYSTIKGGDNYSSKVNDILTQAIAKSVLGEYKFVQDVKNKSYNIVLEGFDGKSDAEKEAFIKAHPAYNNWESSSFKLKLADGNPTIADFEKRINIIKDIIDQKVVSTLWSEANATAYKRNNRFYETLYARNLDEKLYTVKGGDGQNADPAVIGAAPDYTSHYIYENKDKSKFNGFKANQDLKQKDFTEGALIDGSFDVNSEDGLDNIKSVLHVGYYTDYINSSIMPAIMKNLLVEQYVLEENYNAIGQTNSRKLNFINVANNADKNGDKFFTEFVKTYFTKPSAEALKLSTTDKFEIASNAWKGNASTITDGAKTLAAKSFGDATTKNPSANLEGHNDQGVYIEKYATKEISYYKNTPYADLVKEYSTLTHDIATNNTANYDKFTTIDSLTYDPIVGLTIQEDALKVTDYTTYGWQTSDSSSLPEEIKNILFSYGFINEWDAANSQNKDTRFQGTYLYEVEKTNTFLLKTVKFENDEESVLWQEGGNYYVIEVEDIITAERCQISDKDQSADKKFEIEEKARDAAYTLASGSTFTTNAIVHYLEQCNINYHDQDVYDYFASTYPRLFE